MTMATQSPGRDDRPEHAATLAPDEARSAVKLGVMRYVLGISLVGVIVAMLVAWYIFGS
jgi:hypothetical protein